ncbi:MAG: universal stress protein [Candidatus Brocadiaceae bacterium]|nr:universal stress protein [Candidatus Brocadiaceae bacterium]
MIKRILVATDGSENSLAAIDYAISIARVKNASISGVYVKDIKVLAGPLIHDIGTSIGGMVPYGTFNQTVREMLDVKADAALNQVEGKCKRAGVSFVREIREGIVHREIVKSAENCDLVAMGKMGAHAEWRDVFLGTNVEFVVRQTHKPVLITPQKYKPFTRMLIAYGGSAASDMAVKRGAEIAKAMNLPITVVSVADKKGKAVETLSTAEALLRSLGLSVDTIAKEGTDTVGGILDVCKDGYDILVMGAYGHSKLQEMILGSTTVRVMRKVSCPILLYR